MIGDDKILIEGFLSGDERSFNMIVIKYQDMIFNLCHSITGDYDEARDCAQETFIKVYRNLGGFKQKSSLSTWLYRIAVNTCRNRISLLANRISRKAVRLDGLSSSMTASVDIEDGRHNPATMYEEKERRTLLIREIKKLPLKQRILVVLRDIEGKSYDEIGTITGMKPGTVKSKLSRARETLKLALRETLK